MVINTQPNYLQDTQIQAEVRVNAPDQVGSVVCFPAFHLCGPLVRIPSQTRALHVDCVSSPQLIAWVFPIGVFLQSKTMHFFLFPVIGANVAVGCVIKKKIFLNAKTSPPPFFTIV